jgi:hypothetical protein
VTIGVPSIAARYSFNVALEVGNVVERIVAYQPTPERRALFALLYGRAIEVSTARGLTPG